MGNRKQAHSESLGRNQVKGSRSRVSPGPDGGSTAPTTLSSSVPPTPGDPAQLPPPHEAVASVHLSGPEPTLKELRRRTLPWTLCLDFSSVLSSKHPSRLSPPPPSATWPKGPPSEEGWSEVLGAHCSHRVERAASATSLGSA